MRQALQSSQSGDVCRRCIGILVLLNRLHVRLVVPCGVWAMFGLSVARSAISGRMYAAEVSDIIVESAVLSDA